MAKKVAKKERRVPLRWVELTPEMLAEVGLGAVGIAQAFKYSRGVDAFPAVLVVRYGLDTRWHAYEMATFRTHHTESKRYRDYGSSQSFRKNTLEEAKTAGAKWAQKMVEYT